MNFQKCSGEGLTEPSPQIQPNRSISSFAFDSSFDLKSQALCALALGFIINSPLICLIISPQQRGTRKNILLLYLNFLATPLWFITQYINFHISLGSLGGLGPPIFQTSRRLWSQSRCTVFVLVKLETIGRHSTFNLQDHVLEQTHGNRCVLRATMNVALRVISILLDSEIQFSQYPRHIWRAGGGPKRNPTELLSERASSETEGPRWRPTVFVRE